VAAPFWANSQVLWYRKSVAAKAGLDPAGATWEEVIGAAEPGADVEVIAVGNRFLRDLDLSRFEAQVNSVGDQTCRPPYRELLTPKE